MLVIKQLTAANNFHSMAVNSYRQLSGYQHSSSVLKGHFTHLH